MFLQDSCSFCLLSWRYTDRSRDWSIASGRTSWSVGAQQTLPRDLRQAIAFESQTWKFYLSLSLSVSLFGILSFSFTPFEQNRGMYDGSFDLNFNANLGHLSIFHGIPSGWKNDSKLPICIQNFLSLSSPSKRNRSVLRDLRIFSRNKRDSDVERDEIFNSRKHRAK